MSFNKSTIGQECKVGDGAHARLMRQDTGKLYLSAKNFTKKGLSLDDVSYISEKDFRKYFNPKSKALTKPEYNDLILGIIGAGLGVPYLVDNNVEEFGISSSVAIIRPIRNNIDSQYLYYWMIGPYFQKHLKNIQSGSAQGFLSLEMIRSLHLLIPSAPIQRKIASILSAYDELIENNNKRIKLLEEMAEEIYKEWFVRLRFPGYESSKYFDAEGKVLMQGTIGVVPEGWEKNPINSVVNIISGYAFKTESFDSEGSYKLVTIKNVQDGYFVTETTDYIHELPKNLKDNCKLKDKDIILSLTGNIGRICLVYGENYILNQRVAKLQPKAGYLFEFTYLMFRSKFLRSTLENLSNGAAQQNLSPIEMGKLEVLVPEEKILKQFSILTNSFFDEIITLNKKNQILQQTRDLLLPRLISGKLSVEHLLDEDEHLSIAAEPEIAYGKN